MTMAEKVKYPRAAAIAVARELVGVLEPVVSEIRVAGSLRRMKREVGDVEIVFIPRIEQRPDGLFDTRPVDLAAEAIDKLLDRGVLRKREGESGYAGWGPKNKLGVHAASGIPVDLFATTAENWWNYLVCRTGPKESNEAIAKAAQARGWQWNSYGPGFTAIAGGEVRAMGSEQEVFAFVGLPYKEPASR